MSRRPANDLKVVEHDYLSEYIELRWNCDNGSGISQSYDVRFDAT